MLQLLIGEGGWLGPGRIFAFCIAPKSTGKSRGVRAAARATLPGFAALIHMVQGQGEGELPVWAARLGGQYGQARGVIWCKISLHNTMDNLIVDSEYLQD